MAAKKNDTKDLVIPNKRLSITEIMGKLRKEFKSDVVTIEDINSIAQMPRFSSGITALDIILGGGWPIGRIIEIYGPESSGKTTITLHAIVSAQRQGKVCAYIDAEHAYDAAYAHSIGVDTSKLLICSEIGGEKSLAVVESLVYTGSVDLVVVDSVAALVPQKELDGGFGDANVGLHARLMSQAMRKLVGPAQAMGCTIIFINQIREKVGVMYGSPETTTGGRALKFYSSIRLDVRRKETLKEGGNAYANHIAVKTVKNKTFPPMKQAEFDIVFGKGVDNTGSIVDLAVEFGIMTQGGGGYYTYKNLRIQGRPKLLKHLTSEKGAADLEALTEDVRQMLSKDSAMMMNLSAEDFAKTKAQLQSEEEADTVVEGAAWAAGVDTEEKFDEDESNVALST